MVFWKSKKDKTSPQSAEPSPSPSLSKPTDEGSASATGMPIGQKSPSPSSSSSSSTQNQGGISGVKNILAIASGKGGVGKSTVATNLAIALKTMGAKVGLLDADIYGPSQPSMLGSQEERAKGSGSFLVPVEKHGISFVSMGVLIENDGPVVWRAPMAMKILQQFLKNVLWGELDYLLIDLPPGTGDVQITLAQQASLTGAIIVTTPQEVAVNIARKGLMMFEQVNVPIVGIIENMSGFTCNHCGSETEVFHHGGGERLAKEHKTRLLGKIPLDPEIMLSGDEGIPIVIKRPASGPAKSYLTMAQELNTVLRRTQEIVDTVQPKSLGLSPNGEIIIDWNESHHGFHSPYTLRVNCPCANCVDENTGKRILRPQNVPLDIKVLGTQRIGRYGISVRFSDGHSTGIYKFVKLKELCECPQCLMEQKTEENLQGPFNV